MKLLFVLLMCLCTGVENENGEPTRDDAYFRPWVRKQHLARNKGLHSDEHKIDTSYSIYPSDDHHRNSRFKRGAVALLENGAQQLESVVVLTNSLILSEAVRTNKTTIGKIVVDSLLIGQMPSDDVDWIEKVSSKMNAGQAKKLKQHMAKTETLRNMIDKGEAKQVDVDLMSKLNVDVFQTFSNNADQLLKIEEDHFDYDRITLSSELAMKYLVLLPYAAQALRDFDDSANFDVLKTGYKFAEKTFELQAFDLLSECKTTCEQYKIGDDGQENTQRLKECLSNLQTVANSLENEMLGLEKATMVFHFFAIGKYDYYDLAVSESYKDSIAQFKNVLVDKRSQFEKLVKTETHNTDYYQQKIDELNGQKSHPGLILLKKSLDLFVPLVRAADEMKSIYYNQKAKNLHNDSILNGLKSYKCLSSFFADLVNNLSSSLGSSASLSPEYFISGIVKRSEIFQKWIDDINPVIQHSAGLNSIKETAMKIDQMRNISDTVFSDLKDKFSLVEDIVNDLSTDISGVVGALDIILNHMRLLEESGNWKEEFDKMPHTLGSTEYQRLSDFFLILPQYVGFVKKLRNAFSSFGQLHVFNSTQSILEPYYLKMTEFFDMLPEAAKTAEKLKVLPEYFKRNFPTGRIDHILDELKPHIDTVKMFNVTKIRANHEIDINYIFERIEEMMPIGLALSKLQNDKKDILDFLMDISKIFPPHATRKKRNPNSMSNQNIDAAKQLMIGMGKLKKVNTDMNESYQIGQFMKGEPFGNDILDDMYKGMDDYRKISEKVGSTENIQSAIADLKKEDSSLAAKVKILLKGSDSLEITSFQEKINVFDVMAKLPEMETKLEKLQKWVETRNQTERMKIGTELAKLKKTVGLKIKKQVSMLHFLVSKIDKSFVANIEKLREGLKKFQEKLSSIDCEKVFSDDDSTFDSSTLSICKNGKAVFAQNNFE